MTPTRTRSEMGRSSRRKGHDFERNVARALRPWFPDARRSRDNGSTTTSDTGDLADTNPALFWSLKDVAAARTEPPALVAGWLAEAAVKGAGRMPLVVIKRPGCTDPLASWCWLLLDDLALLLDAAFPAGHSPVRMELRHVLDLLAAADYARQPAPIPGGTGVQS